VLRFSIDDFKSCYVVHYQMLSDNQSMLCLNFSFCLAVLKYCFWYQQLILASSTSSDFLYALLVINCVLLAVIPVSVLYMVDKQVIGR
jgi:hypothetical protein